MRINFCIIEDTKDGAGQVIGPFKTLPEAEKQAIEWNTKFNTEGKGNPFFVLKMWDPKQRDKLMKKDSLLHIPIGL
jgi:hypothetical protein